MIEYWWAESGLSGVLAEEYPIVAKSGPTQRRRADAVAIIDSAGTPRTVTWREQSALAARDTVVLQAKASPLRASLAGLAKRRADEAALGAASARLAHRPTPNWASSRQGLLKVRPA